MIHTKILPLGRRRRNLNMTYVIGQVTEVKLLDIELSDISYMPYICTASGEALLAMRSGDPCNRAFTCKGHMSVHKKIHTGEKEFKCDKCSKSFTQKGILISLKRFIMV